MSVPPEKLTDNPRDILHHKDIDVVIEVIGGIEAARTYVTEALINEKHVVTANKDLMALHGVELLHVAEEQGCDLLYEASVAGGHSHHSHTCGRVRLGSDYESRRNCERNDELHFKQNE